MKHHDGSPFLLLNHLFNHKKVSSSNRSSDLISEACHKQILACCGIESKDMVTQDAIYTLVDLSKKDKKVWEVWR